ncbi:Crp/Fnr family transcriptional regulator [Hymenobacter sp. RP-2-7]|uniref:Crp/Fnr family transcriptional regulator n=1 Tax=Hymenobacter polaris TaxID=2682546 RepID=A0A7Y0AIJ6_9BACT|nr:Crp/Fnr family transcriptional regulator [Hymenobacter polaris]NML67987.1 Crp/Fnr family transcriptional regulator [Hymenobacter polaris]
MYTAILANVARYVALTAAEQQAFTNQLQPQHVARHGLLQPAGPPVRYLAFVVRGCVRTYTTDARGREHVLAFAPEGWWSSNFTSALSAPRAYLSLQALEDTEVLLLRLDQLEELCLQVPKFERFFRLLFQNGYLLAQRRLTARAHLSAEARYARFCRHYPQLHQRVALKHIASFLGITPEFLSTLRGRQV